MKIEKYAISLFFLLISMTTLSQDLYVKAITIKYVDFSLLTDSHVDFKTFETAFDFKSFETNDSITVKTILRHINNFRNDDLNNYFPDVRCKILLENKGIICISDFGICYNNKAILLNSDFINYIKSLIKQKDSKFDYKTEK